MRTYLHIKDEQVIPKSTKLKAIVPTYVLCLNNDGRYLGKTEQLCGLLRESAASGSGPVNEISCFVYLGINSKIVLVYVLLLGRDVMTKTTLIKESI